MDLDFLRHLKEIIDHEAFIDQDSQQDQAILYAVLIHITIPDNKSVAGLKSSIRCYHYDRLAQIID